MAYTVKQVANVSGVSIRTLRYYDEIGLLKPAFYGDNNYRYYEEAEVLMLQQILFYRELGFSLDDIKCVIQSADFDKIASLESHRKALKSRINHENKLIDTIDKTIAHLRRKEMVKLEEIFDGFTHDKQKMYEDFLIESNVDKATLQQVNEKVKSWSKDKWIANKQANDKVYAEMAQAIDNNLSASSKEVQVLIKKHYDLVCQIWTPNKDTYIGLSQFYGSHPDFVAFYNNIHPKLLSFLTEGMKIFAENNLT